MPISSYFKGSGSKVMQNMVSHYGAKKGKQVFYATANKLKSKLVDHAMKGRFKPQKV